MGKQEDTYVPRLRFKGFAGVWEPRKLGDISEIVGGGTPSTSIPDYWDGDIDWYAPAEIGDQIFLNGSQRKITEQGYNNSSAKMLPVGTVLFTSRAGIGKTAILSRRGCTNQGFQSIVPHVSELDSYFIFSRTEELKQYGETIGAGSTFVEVSGKQMSNMMLMVPPTLAEQQVIGSSLRSVDNLIVLYKFKCDALKRIKKSFLQKMFPKEGEKFPEIRFPGFTDAWEQRKLGEIVDVRNGKDYKGIPDGEIPVYGTGGYMLSIDQALSYTEDAIGIGRKGTIDKPYLLYAPFWTVDTLFYAIPRTSYVLNFVFDIFQNVDWKKRDESTGVPSLSKTAINDVDILIPSNSEQKQIGTFFFSLDSLITLHQRKLEKLKNIKKSCLEKVFV